MSFLRALSSNEHKQTVLDGQDASVLPEATASLPTIHLPHAELDVYRGTTRAGAGVQGHPDDATGAQGLGAVG